MLEKNWAMENVKESVLISVHQHCCHLVTSVEQLKSGANCLTPNGDTLQLFHNSQITIIMDTPD